MDNKHVIKTRRVDDGSMFWQPFKSFSSKSSAHRHLVNEIGAKYNSLQGTYETTNWIYKIEKE